MSPYDGGLAPRGVRCFLSVRDPLLSVFLGGGRSYITAVTPWATSGPAHEAVYLFVVKQTRLSKGTYNQFRYIQVIMEHVSILLKDPYRYTMGTPLILLYCTIMTLFFYTISSCGRIPLLLWSREIQLKYVCLHRFLEFPVSKSQTPGKVIIMLNWKDGINS